MVSLPNLIPVLLSANFKPLQKDFPGAPGSFHSTSSGSTIIPIFLTTCDDLAFSCVCVYVIPLM